MCTLLPWRRQKHLVGSWVLILAQIVSAAATACSQQPGSLSKGATQVRPAVDQLHGPVRRIRTEIAPVSLRDGKPVEGRRVLFKQATFSADEDKKDDVFYPAKISDPAAEEQYIYDNKGHVTKVVVRDPTGQVAHYHYRYEFDRYGNWTKRVSYVAIVQEGMSGLEPTEVAYRHIEYYPARAHSRLPKPLAEARITGGPIIRSAKTADASGAQVGLALSPPTGLSHGEVSLDLGVSPDGEVVSAKASGGPHRLIYSLAEEAARHARFSPELLREALTDGGGLPAAARGDLSFQRVRVTHAVAKVTPNRIQLTLYVRPAARNGEGAPEERDVATITAILSKTKGRWEMVGSFVGGR